MMNKKLIAMLLIAVVALSVMFTVAPKAEAAGQYTISLADSAGKNTITAKPGDTVTLTLSIANNPGIIGMGVKISYPQQLSVRAHELPEDAAAVMITSGKFSPNIIPTEGNPFGVYMNQGTGTTFGSPKGKKITYNGTVYQITFKVSDTAAAGDYKITLSNPGKSQNLTADTDGNGVIIPGSMIDVTDIRFVGCTIKVESTCSTQGHSYGDWKDNENDKTHTRTCSVCNTPETKDHTWDNGDVQEKPSCTKVGTTVYTCTAKGCGAKKTVNPGKTNHTYGDWKDNKNDKTHTRTCSVCNDPQTADHTWNSGSVTKKATCKEAGEKTYTCTACSAKKTEEIKKLTTHTYDNNCDAECNVCGLTRTITHKYKTSWSKNKTEHWYVCSVCGDKKDVAAHIPGPEATEKNAQKCTACGYVLKAALGHKCTFADKWTTDEDGHWYACSGCEEQSSYALHDFENDCDADCSICGYTRETSHKYAEEYSSDETNHWYACSGCDDKQQLAAHEPGAEATETTAQTCTICGYEIAPALGGATEPSEEPTEEPTEDNKYDVEIKPDILINIPWILIFAVVGAGVLVLVIILLTKKKNDPLL